MMMDERTMEYVASLPAVKAVSAGRIRYADDFKRRVAEGYRRGESPVEMFRKAGLGPEVIGYKRIERCVARWRDTMPEDVESRGSAPMSVVLAQEARINGLERRLQRVVERIDRAEAGK